MTNETHDIRYRIAGDGRTLARAACMLSHLPIDTTIASMTEQGYEILQVITSDACEPCNGHGLIKNGRRCGPLMAFKTCKACDGAGYINPRITFAL